MSGETIFRDSHGHHAAAWERSKTVGGSPVDQVVGGGEARRPAPRSHPLFSLFLDLGDEAAGLFELISARKRWRYSMAMGSSRSPRVQILRRVVADPSQIAGKGGPP